jgi:hypothetical protein
MSSSELRALVIFEKIFNEIRMHPQSRRGAYFRIVDVGAGTGVCTECECSNRVSVEDKEDYRANSKDQQPICLFFDRS